MQSSKKRAWLTPDSEEALAELLCRRFFVPDTPAFRESVSGALLELTYSWNWEQYGTMTPQETADFMLGLYNRYALDTDQCSLVPAPYWDDGDGSDADDEAPEDNQDWYGVLVGETTWQEQIEDWFIAAFVAMAATPAAAIAFLTIAPKFRLAWKTSNWGAIVKIFLDQTEIGTVDTYSASPGIITYDVDASAYGSPVELWVEHSGEHNASATPDANGDYTIQCIRKRLEVEEVEAITNIRQLAGSGQLEVARGGLDVWEEVPTADNVRVNGTVGMTGGLEIESNDAYLLNAYTPNAATAALRLRNTMGDWAFMVNAANDWLQLRANGNNNIPVRVQYQAKTDTLKLDAQGVKVLQSDGGTLDNALQALELSRNGGGTPTPGYAQDFAWKMRAGTTLRDAARVRNLWEVATDASRRAAMEFAVYDWSAARTFMRGGTDGTQPTIGVLGASPQPRLEIIGDRHGNPALANFFTAMSAFGFITDATTEGEIPMTIFRQSPTNTCVLEQSIDAGDNWTEAFDFSLCIPPATATMIEIGAGNIIINPAAPTETFTSQDGDTDAQRQARVDGLCFASKYVVDAMLEAAFNVCNETATAETATAIAVGVVLSILAAAEIISFGALTPLVVTAIPALLAIIASVNALDCAVYQDVDVRAAMQCLMFQNLINRGVTLDNFALAFSGGGCLTGDEADVANVLNQMFQSPAQQEALYESFLNVLAETQSAAMQGATLASCICAATDWCYKWNLTEGLGGWTLVSGTWIEGTGVRMAAVSEAAYADCADTVGLSHAVVLRRKIYLPDGVDLGLDSNSDIGFKFVGTSGTVPTRLSRFKAGANCQAFQGTNIYQATYTSHLTGILDLELIFSNNSGGATLDDVAEIQLQGMGFNTFALCDNC